MSGTRDANPLRGLQWARVMSFLSPIDAASLSIAAGKEQLHLMSADRGQGAREFADRRRRPHMTTLVNAFETLEDAEAKAGASAGAPPARKRPLIQALSSALFNHYILQIAEWDAVPDHDKTFFFRLWYDYRPIFNMNQADWGLVANLFVF